MATLQSGDSPGTRIAAGDSVLQAAETIDTTPIAARLAAFKKVHLAYAAADAKVKKATLALNTKQAAVGEADLDQDAATQTLADVLPADGLPRANPFKPFGAPAPAALCALGYGEEAKELLTLEKAVLKKKGLSNASTDAAKAMGEAAKKVQAALAPIAKLEKARTDAITQRDAQAQTWETAFASLKRGAKAAEDDGAKGLFAVLFERKEPKPKSPKAKKEPAGPAGGGGSAPG